jgi:predicted ATPase/class 3 adenylate cyclase
MSKLPSGTIAYLFTDIEGSTRLWDQNPKTMKVAVERHHLILGEVIKTHGGQVFKIIGDEFQAAFPSPLPAVEAALAAQRALIAEDWGEIGQIKVRMGIHVGPGEAVGDDYAVSHTLNRVARVSAAGHGGQILLSLVAADMVRGLLPEGVCLRDMGRHTLKGLSQPEQIYQVLALDLPQDFLPLKSITAQPPETGLKIERTGSPAFHSLQREGTSSVKYERPEFRPKHNLPAQISSFIGRQREIAEVKRFLAVTRLLTLSGPPGTGKTRLALQVASQVLDQFEDGVYFVELAPISDPRFVVRTIAQVFGIGESGSGSLVENLKNYLHDKQLLLVLDNYEQIIETAPLVSDLLSVAPDLKVMVTSRQVLQVYGEQEYLVPPLSVPDLGRAKSFPALSQYEAVELFCQRAQAVKPDFALSQANASAVAEICVHLDGLPLAIELAAAGSKLLSAEMILNRLENRLETLTGRTRDLPSRLRTLRGTIDWSYDLLEEGEKVLFSRLSVFQGGRTIKAAEAICAPGLSIPVLDGLESLLNKSLLYQEEGPGGEPRFLMLETIHEYAREKLAESGEAGELQRRHADYFAGLAEQAELEVSGAKQGDWFERLRTEHDNLRTALAFSLGSGDSELALRIVGALRDFWTYDGHVVEGQGWIAPALDSAEDASPTLLAKALNAAGMLSFSQGDYRRGKLYNGQALALYRELGDEANCAWALIFLGSHCTGSLSEIKEGMALTEEALALFHALGDKLGIIWALNQIGELQRLDGDYDRAGKVYEECLSYCRQLDDRLREAYALGNLGTVAQHEGNYEQAVSKLKKGLIMITGLHTQYPIPVFLALLSGPIACRGDPERAAQLLGASDSLLKSMGLGLKPSDQPEIDRYQSAVREQLGEEAYQSAWVKGQDMSLEAAIAYALQEETE